MNESTNVPSERITNWLSDPDKLVAALESTVISPVLVRVRLEAATRDGSRGDDPAARTA